MVGGVQRCVCCCSKQWIRLLQQFSRCTHDQDFNHQVLHLNFPPAQAVALCMGPTKQPLPTHSVARYRRVAMGDIADNTDVISELMPVSFAFLFM